MIRPLCAILLAFSMVAWAAGSELQVHRRTLDNGIRATYLHVPDSPSLSIFTLLPLGLASDGAGQTQWSHLLEHMVLRSTIPDRSQLANAETLADHMRLDYYGKAKDWRDALSHHARWLAGLPLPAERLEIEKQRANSEADYAARNLVCHKFAVAAWNQVMRHGRGHAAVKQDLADAPLDELERYRDRRLVVLPDTLVCAVGGVEPEGLLDAVARHVGRIRSKARRPNAIAGLKPRRQKATWDLPARHVLVSWPIATVEQTADYAALTAAAQAMLTRAASDAQIKKLCGPVIAGTDLTSPEGSHLYVSATLRPGADAAAAESQLAALSGIDSRAERMLGTIGRQLARLRAPSFLEMLKAQMPEPSKGEAQFGLMWGLDDFRFGRHRAALTKSLERQTAQSIRSAMKKYLRPSLRSTLVLVTK